MGYSTTGLAVGLAIGVPTLVVAIIALFFLFRGKRRLERELDKEDANNMTKDIDFDEISFNHDSTDINTNTTVYGNKAAPEHRSATLNKLNSDTSLLAEDDTGVDHGSSSAGTDPGTSKTTRKSSQNYLDYYDSVIPVLPQPRGGFSTNHSSQSSLSSSNQTPTTQTDTTNTNSTNNNNSSSYNFIRRLSKTTKRSSGQLLAQSVPQDQSLGSQQSEYSGQFPVPGIQYAPLHFRNETSTSVNSDYIKQLNRNDSSSFPNTTHTLANASNHAINVYNNFNSSRSGSDQNLLNKLKKSTSSANILATTPAQSVSELNSQLPSTNTDSDISAAVKKPEEEEEDTTFVQDQDTSNRLSQHINNALRDEDSMEGDSGIIEDDGYTNYEDNKKSFLSSLRPV